MVMVLYLRRFVISNYTFATSNTSCKSHFWNASPNFVNNSQYGALSWSEALSSLFARAEGTLQRHRPTEGRGIWEGAIVVVVVDGNNKDKGTGQRVRGRGTERPSFAKSVATLDQG